MWTAIALAPQFKGCVLEDQQGDAVYLCRTELEEAQQPMHLIAPIMQLVSRCLGPDWTSQLARGTGRNYKSGVFSNGSSVEFEVGLRREPQMSDTEALGVPAVEKSLWRVEFKAMSLGSPTPALWSNAEQASFCAQLQEIVAAAPDDFSALKGAPTEPNEWAATKSLPRMTQCSVTRLPIGSTYYGCELGKLPSRGAVGAAQRQLAGQSLACLGSVWKEKRLAYGDGLWNHQIDGPDDVSVGLRARPRRGNFSIMFDVDNDK